jgi:PAS domain-containing protein
MQKNAELARLQSEKRFQALVQHGSDLIVLLMIAMPISGMPVKMSNAFWAIHPAEIIGQNAYDFIHPDDHSKSRKRTLSEY